MGIGLDDARLLVQKFKSPLRENEFQRFVNAVRYGNAGPKGKQKSIMAAVDFSWQHYNENKQKFVTVAISNGGGIRKHSFSRTTLLNDVFEHMKGVFFPKGRNKFKGLLCPTYCKFCGTRFYCSYQS